MRRDHTFQAYCIPALTTQDCNDTSHHHKHKLDHCIPPVLLSEAEVSVPLRPSVNKYNVIQDCECFFNSLRWAAFLHQS